MPAAFAIIWRRYRPLRQRGMTMRHAAGVVGSGVGGAVARGRVRATLAALLAGAAGAVLLAAGCREKAPAKNGGKLRFAFVTNNPSNFWKIARKGCEEAERTLGISVEFRMPANGQAPEQRQIIDDLLVKRVDGIAISPIDPANQTPMLNRVAEQTILICHDSDAPESKRSAYVGTNNVEAGRAGGRLIKEVLPDGGKVMLFVGTLDAQNARDRRQGILDELEGSGIEVLGTRTDNTDRARARGNVEDTLVSNPDVGCLVGLWSYNGPTIAQAVKAAGKSGKIGVVCFDEDDVTLQAIQEGVIYGTVVQQPFKFGLESMRVLKALAERDTSAIPADGIVDTGVVLVRKGNVDEFWNNLKDLLK